MTMQLKKSRQPKMINGINKANNLNFKQKNLSFAAPQASAMYQPQYLG